MEWSTAAQSASQTVLVGKRKKGSSLIHPQHPLCILTTQPTSPPTAPPRTYTILATVRGQLLEVNDAIVTDPSLLSDTWKSQWEGHVAVVLMDKSQRQTISSTAPHALYKTKEEWEKAWEARRARERSESGLSSGGADEKG